MLITTTSVTDRRVTIREEFTTHPFEAGWALEGIFFVQRMPVDEAPMSVLAFQPQISPDGIHWIDRGAASVMNRGDDIGAVEVTSFGNWTRLRITGATSVEPSEITVHLSLKG